jgi:hypothetical protein
MSGVMFFALAQRQPGRSLQPWARKPCQREETVMTEQQPTRYQPAGEALDLSRSVAIELPCDHCGGYRAVTLQQILLSQDMLANDGCLALHGEGECPPASFAPLAEHDLIVELLDAWQRLEQRARAAGGRLAMRPTGAS